MQSQSHDRMLYFARVRTRILKAQWVGPLHFKTFRLLSTLIMDEAAEPARKRRRKDADTLATELLVSGKLLSDADVLSVLSRWTFQKNKNRQNVIPDGSEFVYSDTLGLTKDRRGTIAVEAYTRDRPSVFRFLCEWLKQR